MRAPENINGICVQILFVLFAVNCILVVWKRKSIERRFEQPSENFELSWKKVAYLTARLEKAFITFLYLKTDNIDRYNFLTFKNWESNFEREMRNQYQIRENLTKDNYLLSDSAAWSLIKLSFLFFPIGCFVIYKAIILETKSLQDPEYARMMISAIPGLYKVLGIYAFAHIVLAVRIWMARLTPRAKNALKKLEYNERELLTTAQCSPDSLEPERMGLAVALWGEEALEHDSFVTLRLYLYPPHSEGGGGGETDGDGGDGG